jgi:hypothetical protein
MAHPTFELLTNIRAVAVGELFYAPAGKYPIGNLAILRVRIQDAGDGEPASLPAFRENPTMPPFVLINEDRMNWDARNRACRLHFQSVQNTEW